MSTLGPAARTFRMHGAYTAIFRHYQDQGWTDGLPIVPPTDEDLREFLRFTDRAPREVVAVLPPRQGEATVERIAINAIMAGCRPEYLPVVITAVEALADPAFNLDSIQATTHPVAPLIIVNGPIAKEVGINAGYNAFGQGFRANLTIGRAIRLLLMNVGGGLPGTGDRATQGSPAKIAYCVAENEDANPWEPLHVEHGYSPETSTGVCAVASFLSCAMSRWIFALVPTRRASKSPALTAGAEPVLSRSVMARLNSRLRFSACMSSSTLKGFWR